MDKDSYTFREARVEDVPHVVSLLMEDKFGKNRESFSEPLPDCYFHAFEKIQSSRDNELIVLDRDGEIIGCMQLTFIPYLTFQGGTRCLIEGVRISPKYRHQGLGEKLFKYAIDKAQSNRCHMVQLTTNKERQDAFKFYKRLGFSATHEGFKLYLNNKIEE